MKKIGCYTFELNEGCYIIGCGCLVGDKEKNGAFKNYFKNSLDDDKMGESTFEKGERKMLLEVNKLALKDAMLTSIDVDVYLGGDLMNQIVSSNYVAEKLQIPFIGIYSACSTLTATLGLGSTMIESGGFQNILCSTISHFSSAERQYRYPLEFGNQRQCYSQWTVTAGGSFILSKNKSDIKITKVSFGRVQDYGVVDIANMGAAMAPAACDTFSNFLKDTKTCPDDYDLIVTGDLGKLGSDIFRDLMKKNGFDVGQNYIDCGHAIFLFKEDSYQGGSGAGCSAAVLASYIIQKMKEDKFKKVLIIATGALMSTITNQQGDSIPCVSHLVELSKV